MLFISEAIAQTTTAAADPAAAGGAGAMVMQFLPLILIFIIFYALLIRPQQKRARDHQALLDNLRKGDRVVTGGGIFGTVTKIDGNEVVVEIADNVRIRVQKGSIGDVQAKTEPVAANDSAK